MNLHHLKWLFELDGKLRYVVLDKKLGHILVVKKSTISTKKGANLSTRTIYEARGNKRQTYVPRKPMPYLIQLAIDSYRKLSKKLNRSGNASSSQKKRLQERNRTCTKGLSMPSKY